MKLSEFKLYLKNSKKVEFQLPNGDYVPSHFHVTEVGLNSKKYIDCGSNIRITNKVNFQLWFADDYNHKISPEKLLRIIELSEKTFMLMDLEIEIEFQQSTIGVFDLDYKNDIFQLINKKTDCLDKEKCGFKEIKIAEYSGINNQKVCNSEDGCC
tara:strand:+ start:113 stop:577 length:465 start_codon:yes stop_codon:yes gene_type:complete